LETAEPQFNAKYWAGIDCSGLVVRSLQFAHSRLEWLDLQGYYAHPMDSIAWINSSKLFDPQLVFFMKAVPWNNENAVNSQHEKLKQGDLVSYSGHVSFVYFSSPSSGRFQILHAFGNNYYSEMINNIKTKIFSRKVIITEDNVSHALTRPKGYGRIRLWN
jgi:hypothetical protein